MKLAQLAACALLTMSSVSIAKTPPPPPEPETRPDWANVSQSARAALVSTLFDPGSAEIVWTSGFRWGYTKPIIGARTFGWIACGRLNAKNRLGGYVGAKPFWVKTDLTGLISYDISNSTLSSCDVGPFVPVNPELVNYSPTTTASAVTGIADELEKLAGLRDKGIISAAEFETQKAKLLAR